MNGSWKTTAAGIGGIMAVIGSALAAMFDTDPATVPDWTSVIAGITMGIGLICSRDNDKSSEQVGAQ